MLLRQKPFFANILLLIFVFCIFSSTVLAAYGTYTGRVLLRDGTKYEDITFKVNQKFKTLSFEYFHSKVNISFSKIDIIYDSDENDITQQVLGDYYKSNKERPITEKAVVVDSTTKVISKGEPWISQQSTKYKKSKEKLWSTAIIASPRYSIPSGTYYTGTSGGVGFGADLLIAMTKMLTLRFTVAKANIQFDPPFDFIPISTYRYFVSFQYNRQLPQEKPDKSMYYFYSGMGTVSDDLASYFALTAGVGLIKMVSPELGINTELSIDIPGAYDETIQALIFDFKLGITVVL